MPLSAPETDRRLIHTRAIEMQGFARADGLYDIEAHLVDTKTYPFENMDRGAIPAGEPLHGMWLRLVVGEDMVIRACEASTDFAPYAVCPGAAPNFAALAGVSIGMGFNRAVKDRVGGSVGCTHLRELLAQMATVAFQTIGPLKWRKAREEAARLKAEGLAPPGPIRKLPIGSCLAYAPDSPVVARHQAAMEE
ncbi:MAG: DUF2889 domain-containing protein [Roseomonas sp.]|nr:DUF2889 domain-containing protein [Roseomonas sp.]